MENPMGTGVLLFRCTRVFNISFCNDLIVPGVSRRVTSRIRPAEGIFTGCCTVRLNRYIRIAHLYFLRCANFTLPFRRSRKFTRIFNHFGRFPRRRKRTSGWHRRKGRRSPGSFVDFDPLLFGPPSICLSNKFRFRHSIYSILKPGWWLGFRTKVSRRRLA